MHDPPFKHGLGLHMSWLTKQEKEADEQICVHHNSASYG